MKPLADLPDDELARHLREALTLREAPPALVHAAIGLWRPPPVSLNVIVRRLLAVLAFDSAVAAPGVRAVRSGGRSTARQLLFNAEGRDVDLRITAVDGRFALIGQVLGPDETGRIDVLADEDIARSMASSTLDDLGEFRIDDLGPGRYRLVLTLGSDEVTLPTIAVGD